MGYRSLFKSKKVEKIGFLKGVSSLLVFVFLFQELAFASPDLKIIAWGGAETENSKAWARKLLPSIPESVATIEDAYKSSDSNKTVILIQDAHTNNSGQFNVAKVLDLIFQKELIKYVFTEAGAGNLSLSFLRKYAGESQRKQIAESFVRQGKLQGTEYLDLTSNHDFTLWGVEDQNLYAQSVDTYKEVASQRAKFQDYLSRIDSAIEVLKSQIYNSLLLSFDQKYKKYQKEEISLTDYFGILGQEAKKMDVPLNAYPHLMALSKLKELESKIDFKKANEEQEKAVLPLSQADQKALADASKKNHQAFKLSSGAHDVEKAYFALLEEKIGNQAAYLELSKYFRYLKEVKKIDPKKILEEQKLLEKDVFQALAVNQDERSLIQASKNLSALKKLLNLTLTPDDFKEYQADKKDFDITHLTGFLNKKIMDLKRDYDKVTFLEKGYEDVVKKCEAFYELTLERDQKFVQNVTQKMNATNEKEAVLITGGYHTPNLKYLLKEKGISFVSITPQVLSETNQKRYEELLLAQKVDFVKPPVSVASPVFSTNMLWQLWMRYVLGMEADGKTLAQNFSTDPVVVNQVLEKMEKEKKDRDNLGGPSTGRGGAGFAGGWPAIVSRVFSQSKNAWDEEIEVAKKAKLGARLATTRSKVLGIENMDSVGFASIHQVEVTKPGEEPEKVRPIPGSQSRYEVVKLSTEGLGAPLNLRLSASATAEIVYWRSSTGSKEPLFFLIYDRNRIFQFWADPSIFNPIGFESLSQIYRNYFGSQAKKTDALRGMEMYDIQAQGYLMGIEGAVIQGQDLNLNFELVGARLASEKAPLITLKKGQTHQINEVISISVIDIEQGRALVSADWSRSHDPEAGGTTGETNTVWTKEGQGLWLYNDKPHVDTPVAKVVKIQGNEVQFSIPSGSRFAEVKLKVTGELQKPEVQVGDTFRYAYDRSSMPLDLKDQKTSEAFQGILDKAGIDGTKYSNPRVLIATSRDSKKSYYLALAMTEAVAGKASVLILDLIGAANHPQSRGIYNDYAAAWSGGEVLRSQSGVFVQVDVREFPTASTPEYNEVNRTLTIQTGARLAVKITPEMKTKAAELVAGYKVKGARLAVKLTPSEILGELGRKKAAAVIPIGIVGRQGAIDLGDLAIKNNIAAEITFRGNPEDVVAAIQELRRRYPDEILAAGTVTNVEQVEKAVQAGANIIVSPGNSPDVIRRAVELGVLVIPTATDLEEAKNALTAGAQVFKYFPPSLKGVDNFIEEMKGPLGQDLALRFQQTLDQKKIRFEEFDINGAQQPPTNQIASYQRLRTHLEKGDLTKEVVFYLPNKWGFEGYLGKIIEQYPSIPVVVTAGKMPTSQMQEIKNRPSVLNVGVVLSDQATILDISKNVEVKGARLATTEVKTPTNFISSPIAVGSPEVSRTRFFLSVGRNLPKGFQGDLSLMKNDLSHIQILSVTKNNQDILLVVDTGTKDQYSYDVSNQALVKLHQEDKHDLSQATDLTEEMLKLNEKNGIPVLSPVQATAKIVLVDSFPDLANNAFYQSLILHFSQTLAQGSQVIFVSQEDGKAEKIAGLARTLGVKNQSQFVSMKKEELEKLRLPTSFLLADSYLDQAKAMFGKDQKYFRLQSPEEKDLIGVYALTLIGVLMDWVSVEDWEHAAQLYSQVIGRNVNADELQAALRGALLIPFVSKLIGRLVAQVYMAERAIGGAA